MKDWTKRKLPVVGPDDFIFLKAQEEYQVELVLDTAIASDSSWRYIPKEKVDLQWGEGSRELSAGEYKITAEYENSIVGIGDHGDAIHAHDVQTVIVKMHNAWFGIVASYAIPIKITEGT